MSGPRHPNKGEALKLYGYWRSSATYRVRIALHLKGLHYQTIPIDLLKNGGEQHRSEYQQINPQPLVPTLVDGGITLHQSLPIIEYLDERYPNIPLLPKGAELKAEVRGFSQIIAADIHPLNNLRVLQYLSDQLNASDQAKRDWYHYWLIKGLNALEVFLQRYHYGGPYCFGPEITLADLCLIPQIYNAERYECPLDAYPRLKSINEACLKLTAIQKAHPDRQPDGLIAKLES
jgi:maleylacetoacetate isomerase